MLIALDMDDTLYLEQDYVRSGFMAVDRWLRRRQGLSGFFDEAWALFCEGSRGTIFNTVLDRRNVFEDGLVRELVAVYRSHLPEISLLSDAEAFLKKHDKKSLALITDGPVVSQYGKIKVLQLERYIGNIIVTDELGAGCGKPNSLVFEQVQGSRKSEDCVYIADNPRKDFIGPLALGWRPSVRMRRVNSLHFHLPTPDSCLEVTSFEELSGLGF